MPAASHMRDLQPFVDGLFVFIDSLSKVHLRPETKNKLKKVREGLDKDLKADAEKDKKEEVGCFRGTKYVFFWLMKFCFRWSKLCRIVRLRKRRLKRRRLLNLVLLNSARFVFIPASDPSFERLTAFLVLGEGEEKIHAS